MMRNTALILAACSLLIPAAQAQGTQQTEGQTRAVSRDVSKLSSRNFRKLTVPGEEVAKNVSRLTKEMKWHGSLSSALAAGRAKGKPVLWIQALGELKGYL